VWLGNDFCRLDGTMEIAGHNGINSFGSKTSSHLLSLSHTLGIQFALGLSLHDLAGIINSLAMTYQKNSCHFHGCKYTTFQNKCVYLQQKKK